MSKKKDSFQVSSGDKSLSIVHEEEELPSPEILQKYQSIDPKFADFVINYTRQEQNHRHAMTTIRDKRFYKLTHGDFFLNMMALIAAFVLILAFLILSAWLFYLKRPWFGTGAIVTTFISFASIFAQRKSHNSVKRNTKK